MSSDLRKFLKTLSGHSKPISFILKSSSQRKVSVEKFLEADNLAKLQDEFARLSPQKFSRKQLDDCVTCVRRQSQLSSDSAYNSRCSGQSADDAPDTPQPREATRVSGAATRLATPGAPAEDAGGPRQPPQPPRAGGDPVRLSPQPAQRPLPPPPPPQPEFDREPSQQRQRQRWGPGRVSQQSAGGININGSGNQLTFRLPAQAAGDN